ncbi:MAG: glycosyltransferase family 39 protein, partial [Candidatus Hydrogenedentales bacterium]
MPTTTQTSKHFAIGLALILLAATAVRLYHVTDPPWGIAAWRDTNTRMIANNFAEGSMNLFVPRHDIRLRHQAVDESRVGMTELMVTPWLTSWLFRAFGESWWSGRVVPIVFSVAGVAMFALFLRRLFGGRLALVAAFILALSPYYWYFGRAHMPEAFALAMVAAALCFLDRYLVERRMRDFVLAIVTAALMLMAKPQLAGMTLPLAYLVWLRRGTSGLGDWRLYFLAALVAAPFFAYMAWTAHLARDAGQGFSGDWMYRHVELLSSRDYYRTLASGAWTSLTPVVVLLAVIGLFPAKGTEAPWFPHVLLSGSLTLFVLLPGSAILNAHYLIALAPPAALLAAFPIAAALERPRLAMVGVLALLVVAGWSLYTGYRLFVPVHRDLYVAGTWIRDNTPPESLVLASTPNPALLYFADRVGWPGWPPSEGRNPHTFDIEYVREIRDRGATIAAIPQPWFENAWYADFRGVRDYLYDNFYYLHAGEFAAFDLTRPADLTLPNSGIIQFGHPTARRYLRGSWGPDE